jgi:hypothetical protein
MIYGMTLNFAGPPSRGKLRKDDRESVRGNRVRGGSNPLIAQLHVFACSFFRVRDYYYIYGINQRLSGGLRANAPVKY